MATNKILQKKASRGRARQAKPRSSSGSTSGSISGSISGSTTCSATCSTTCSTTQEDSRLNTHDTTQSSQSTDRTTLTKPERSSTCTPDQQDTFQQGQLFPELKRDRQFGAVTAPTTESTRSCATRRCTTRSRATRRHNSRDSVKRKQPSKRSPFPSPTGPGNEHGEIGTRGTSAMEPHDWHMGRSNSANPDRQSRTPGDQCLQPNRPVDARHRTETSSPHDAQPIRRSRATEAAMASPPRSSLRSGDFLEGREFLETHRSSENSGSSESSGRDALHTRIHKTLTGHRSLDGGSMDGSSLEGSSFELTEELHESTTRDLLAGMTMILVLTSLLFVASMAA